MTPADHDAITQLIAQMETAWNSGDFEGYMQGFANPDVIFVSRGRVQADWQATLDHYVRDYGGRPGSQGELQFSILSILPLGPDAAQLLSEYRLTGGRAPQEGINTRILTRRPEGWRITMNHVSSK